MKRTAEDFDNVVRELENGMQVSELKSSGKFSHLGKSAQTPKTFIASCNSGWRAITEARKPGSIKRYKQGDCYKAAVALLNGNEPDKSLCSSARYHTKNVFKALERINNKKVTRKSNKHITVTPDFNTTTLSDLDDCDTQSEIAILFDIEEVGNDTELSDTEKQAIIKSRIGQGEFRKNVIETWGFGESCPVTKVSIREMLIASHIKPWRRCQSKEERLDGANGILLCSHLDKLFDNYLLSFEKHNGKYIGKINKNIDLSQLKRIGLEDDLLLDTSNINNQNQARLDLYLKEHFRIFSEK